jgi:hypothetical protein
VLFFEDFADPASMDRFGSVAWHRGNLGGATTHGDHAPVAGNDPDACTNPFTTRALPKYADDLHGFDPVHVYRCAPGDDPAKGHVMTVAGEQSGYDFTAMWTAEPLSNVTEVRWDGNITDNGDRNWPEVAVVPAENWNPLQPPCAITFIPCFTTAEGGAGDEFGAMGHADLGSVGMSWFNVRPLIISPLGENAEDWFFRNDWTGSIYDVMEAQHQAFSSPAPRFTHVLRDNGDGTISFLIDTETAEYGVYELTTAGSFPEGDVVVAFKAHDYTSHKDATRLYDTFTWHWDNIEISGRP